MRLAANARLLLTPSFLLALSIGSAPAQVLQLPSGPTMPQPGPAGMPRDQAPREKTGTGRLSGRVLAADTGLPIRRAMVRALSPETPQGRSVSTDAEGRWELKGLPAGRFTVQISKGGFVTLAYGQRRPFEGGKVLELADGQALERLDVSLPRAGVITGTIVDEFGEPASNVRVTAMRHRFVAGRQRLIATGPGDVTDDIGQYRIHGLSPGEYYVAAAIQGAMMFGSSDDRMGYTQTFYLGTPVQNQAQRVSVAEGQEAQPISFALVVSRVATLSGTGTNSSGRPVASGMLTLVSTNPDGMTGGFGIPLRPDGTFTYSNVAPGEYRLQVQHLGNGDQIGFPGGAAAGGLNVTETASVVLNVTGEDITGISLVTAPAGTAAGRIRFEGTPPPSLVPGSLSVIAPPLEAQPMQFGGSTRVRDNWTFELSGLVGRRRVSIGNAPPGWYLRSVTYDGHDVTDSGMEFREGQRVEGLEIVLTQQGTELSGSVQDSGGRPAADYVVVAFSTDRSRWGYMSRYVRAVRPNQDGRFSLKGLPPDEYQVVALEYLEPGEEGDSEQLDRWRAHATTVPLGEGETRTVALRLAQ